jgi:hypothetical protein
MTNDYADARYTYPGALTQGGKYAKATSADVAVDHWRCGACIGRDTRAWRELGRPASTRRPPDVVLRQGDT